MAKKIFYGRCSTEAQNLARQEEAAAELGIAEENRYFDKISGTKKSRPELDRMLANLEQGDEVFCLSLDRLSRSLQDLCSLMETLQEKGASVHLIHENMVVDTTSPMGKLSFNIFACLAEWQRECILQSCAEGRAAKIKAEGRCGGRKPIPQITKDNVCSMKERGCSIQEIMAETKLSRASVYNVLKERNEE